MPEGVGGVGAIGPVSYTPVLQGATDNPVPTYTTQQGRYWLFGKLCFVQVQVVTSTMTKTTLTDQIRLSLPIAAANVAGTVSQLQARLENSTPIQSAENAETSPNNAWLTFRMTPTTTASVVLTYALTSIGALTNTVTINVTGFYETV
jgi:hypothetical protein